MYIYKCYKVVLLYYFHLLELYLELYKCIIYNISIYRYFINTLHYKNIVFFFYEKVIYVQYFLRSYYAVQVLLIMLSPF